MYDRARARGKNRSKELKERTTRNVVEARKHVKNRTLKAMEIRTNDEQKTNGGQNTCTDGQRSTR